MKEKMMYKLIAGPYSGRIGTIRPTKHPLFYRFFPIEGVNPFVITVYKRDVVKIGKE